MPKVTSSRCSTQTGSKMIRQCFGGLGRLARQQSTLASSREAGSRWSRYGAAVISTGASLVAMYSAYDSRRNLAAQQRKEFGRAFAELQDVYYTSEMNRYQRTLYNLKKRAKNEGRDWDDVCGEWAADDLTFALTPPEKRSKEQQIRMKEVEDIEEARRMWRAFFLKFRSLYERGVISREDVKRHHFPNETQMKGYISAVDALEHASAVIFVGNEEAHKRYMVRYRQDKTLSRFLDKTFLDGSNTPTEEKTRERHEKYVRLRKQVLKKMKP